jgi:carboxylate-amine ligase
LRAPDCCTHIDHALAIAALYRSLVRHLYRTPIEKIGITVVDRAIAAENKWRAQRYGVQGSFATRSGPISVGEMLDQVVRLTATDAQVLGCFDEVQHCRVIASRGTSADEQLEIYDRHSGQGGIGRALREVGCWLAAATVQC